MSTRSEREKKQSLNDHHKKVLAQLIAKEDNKFCADCLTKGNLNLHPIKNDIDF